jgi:hypothetical protein
MVGSIVGVESRRGAAAWGHASLHFQSPLIEPDARISRIRLSDQLHLKAHDRFRDKVIQLPSPHRRLFPQMLISWLFVDRSNDRAVSLGPLRTRAAHVVKFRSIAAA